MIVFKGHKIQVNHLLNVIPESLLTTDNFSIVTVKANPFMADIHNNSKLKESRMPLILSNDNADLCIHTLSN